MTMSHLTDKSKILIGTATLLNEKGANPAVAHCAYYCCVQLMKHIWLHSLHKTEQDLKNGSKKHNMGTHEFLIRQIGSYIKRKNETDFRCFNNDIVRLKTIRVDADYSDKPFDVNKSKNSLALSNKIAPILQKY